MNERFSKQTRIDRSRNRVTRVVRTFLDHAAIRRIRNRWDRSVIRDDSKGKRISRAMVKTDVVELPVDRGTFDHL